MIKSREGSVLTQGSGGLLMQNESPCVKGAGMKPESQKSTPLGRTLGVSGAPGAGRVHRHTAGEF